MNTSYTITRWLDQWLLSAGIPPLVLPYLAVLMLGIGLFLALSVIDMITRNGILMLVKGYAKRSKNPNTSIFIERRVFKYLAHLIPALLALKSIPLVFHDFPGCILPLQYLIDSYIVVSIVFFVQAILRATKIVLLGSESFKDKPIGSYTQLLNIFNYAIGILLIASNLTQKPLWTLLTAFGALSALIILTFRDTILGFVASIQISGNDIVRLNDWIEIPKYGADGHVVEINLTTIKVQNWDNTISSIPTYALINDSFKNWRGMEESNGRRIKRSVNIKISSIRFCSASMLAEYKKIALIRAYIIEKEAEIDAHNKAEHIDKTVLANGRNLTNIGVFREYLMQYISNHSDVNTALTLMVRQLPPTEKGLPIEVYCFTLDKKWISHETTAANLFDHILASLSSFDLEIFENASTKEPAAAFVIPAALGSPTA
ncbi:MAG: mechanosensitive ion channel protein MscS [Flavobacteriales bacterium]|nr:MAG: mechanosensitive ion channel protein MscS [Flavobacteriales bacterium]